MIIGITGGIGSGKSCVTDILDSTGKFTVLKTDDIARLLMNEDPELKSKLISIFGSDIYDKDGKLNKAAYASKIYQDPDSLKKSNDTIHPAVWKKVNELVTEIRNKKGNAVVETALPDDCFRRICDNIWFVSANATVRKERLMKYRGYSSEYAETILKKQQDDSFYRRFSDKEIKNDGTLEDLKETVLNEYDTDKL